MALQFSILKYILEFNEKLIYLNYFFIFNWINDAFFGCNGLCFMPSETGHWILRPNYGCWYALWLCINDYLRDLEFECGLLWNLQRIQFWYSQIHNLVLLYFQAWSNFCLLIKLNQSNNRLHNHYYHYNRIAWIIIQLSHNTVY